MSSVVLHCRLCAGIKPMSKLIDLISEHTTRSTDEIAKKLKCLNVNTTVFEKSDLPKTVCLICLNDLDKAYEFAQRVQYAQQLLVSIGDIVKKEEVSDDDTPESLPQPVFEPIIPVKKEPVAKTTSTISKQPVVKKKPDESNSNLTWKDYIWVCGKCGMELSTIQEFRTHCMTYHGCCNAFQCTDCRKKMLRLDKFVLHVKRHRNHLKLSCYDCHSKFPTPHKVNEHMKMHTSYEDICCGCNTTFNSTEALNEHIKLYFKNLGGNPIAALDTSDDLSCSVCQKTFNNRGTLNGHLLIHIKKIQAPKERVHVCDRCGKGYFYKADLVNHVTTFHNDARPFKCDICEADFKTIRTLRLHVKTHDSFKPFACAQCGRKFRLQKQLKSHEIIHTDAMPYVCSVCNKAFKFSNVLNLHKRQHTGYKPYSCEPCLRNFTNWSNYNKHMKRRHGTSMVKRKVVLTNDKPPADTNVSNEDTSVKDLQI